MSIREIPGAAYNGETQNRILEKATELFALNGFNSVSLRDIAKAVNIKMSSVQYYYKHKETLLKDVLSHFENGYRHYFDWLREENRKAESLEDLLNNFFNTEFVEMHDPMGCLGMSLILKEQHVNALARELTFTLFYEHSVNCIRDDIDQLIKRNILPPANVKMIATLFMLGVMVINDIRLHRYYGNEPPIDYKEIFNSMRNMIALAFGMTADGVPRPALMNAMEICIDRKV